MFTKIKKITLPLVVLLTYAIMIAVNALANILPINGKGTGEVSDSYGNLFAPAGITFSIWGVIYLLLFIFCINLIRIWSQLEGRKIYIYNKVSQIFAISSVLNSIWIFSWHYEIIWLSELLMVGILVALIWINLILRKEDLSKGELFLLKLPFAVYLGWITVATIANTTILLVSLKWDGFSIPEVIWTDIIILIGAVIGIASMLFYRSFSYGLVLVWAYVGIFIKHISENGFDGKYPSVLVVVSFSIFVFFVGEILLFIRLLKQQRE